MIYRTTTLTRAVPKHETNAMRDACERDPRPIGARDLAIELIFSVTGCRRDALTKLNLASVERLPEAGCRAGERVFIVFHEKGNVVRQVPLSSDAAKALDRWLEVRGDWEGALFTPCSKSGQLLKGASAHRRLKPRAVNAMLDRRAKQAGIPLRQDSCRPDLMAFGGLSVV